ncbi:MAG: 2-C-methyl-D-erythritol 4-phosphate cytidylyltransferase [Planctomycetota bacterium]|nr:2-C-methyl-D-erythritol 4-phosphate cytidylyltransferase [Planctomycetota bacterium]
MAKFAVILPAAGKSTRFRDKEKKPFAALDGRPVWLRTAELFVSRDDVCQCILVIDPSDEEMVRRKYGANMAFLNISLVHGGSERFESVSNALKIVKDDVDFVAIHDSVRPCVTTELIDKVFQQAVKSGAAILALGMTDSLKRGSSNEPVVIEQSLPRERLWLAQTPQVFSKEILIKAFKNVPKGATDDSQVVEATGAVVSIVVGSSSNIKITTRDDLFLADAILKSRPKPKANASAHPFADDMFR